MPGGRLKLHVTISAMTGILLLSGCNLKNLVKGESRNSTVSLSKSTVTLAAATVISGQSIEAVVHLRNKNGDPLIEDLDLEINHGGGTSTATFSPFLHLGGGAYSASVTGVTAGDPTLISVTVDGEAITPALP